jgi:hypothetical protein
MFSLKKNSNIDLVIDKNCPQWKKLLINFKKDSTFRDRLDQTAEFYFNQAKLICFHKKELKNSGYKIKTILKNFF